MIAIVQSKLRAEAQVILTAGAWCVVGLAGLGVFYLSLLVPTLTPGFVAAIKVVTVLTICMVGVQSHLSALSMVRAARVLGQRLVPMPLWSAWFKSTLAPMQWALGASALGSVLLLALAESPLRWVTGAALMSVCATLVFVRVLVTRGFLPRPWAWGIWAVMALLFVLVLSAGDELSALDVIGQLPLAVQLLGLAAWPAVYCATRARWSQRIPNAHLEHGAVQLNLWRRAENYLKRYVPLRSLGGEFPNAASKGFTQHALFLWLFVVTSGTFHRLPRMVPTWDSQLSLEHVPLTILMICFSFHVLVCKDWHWRALMAPGGLHRGRLGTHIFLSTLQLLALFTGGLWLLYAVVSQLAGESQALVSGSVLERFALLPLQAVFAIAIATALRATRYPRVAIAVMLVFLLITHFALKPISDQIPAAPDWFRAGPVYVGVLLGLTAAALWLSNRLWTAQRLMVATSSWRG
mgnify:CR=1 FL=1